MGNKRIAKKLIRIAKELVLSDNVASSPNDYNNFTGKIKTKYVDGDVRNANFYIEDNGTVYWFDGTWIDGEWKLSVWEKGTWHNGVFEDGYWETGTWYNGIFDGGIWKDGTWHKGIWKSGDWDGGYDNVGNFYEIDDSPDKW